jgi:DNA-binding beta-propeller fold protein YncE
LAIVGPAGAVTPVGSACGIRLCWYSDSSTDTLWVNNGSNTAEVSVGYDPGGVAFDELHNRVFVAGPLNNAVHVYNAQTLALEKTIT